MYYLNSILLHKDKDYVVNYSQRGYDSPYSMNITVNGDEFEEWYYDLEKRLGITSAKWLTIAQDCLCICVNTLYGLMNKSKMRMAEMKM